MEFYLSIISFNDEHNLIYASLSMVLIELTASVL